MKLILFLFLPVLIISQEYRWPVGYNSATESNKSFWIAYKNGEIFYDTLLNPDVSIESATCALFDSINNSLIFYTNGCEIYNNKNEIIPNGSELSKGELANTVCSDYGYPLEHSITAIYYPGSQLKYILLHMLGVNNNELNYNLTELQYSVLELNSSLQPIDVLEKNVVIKKGNLIPFGFTKHANGRDWWVVVTEKESNTYFIFLISPEGINLHYTQQIGEVLPRDICTENQRLLFSPNGDICARYSKCGIDFLRFDRCSGSFYSTIFFNYKFKDLPGGDISFSLNTKYLLVSNWNEIIRIKIEGLGVSAFPYTRNPLIADHLVHQLCLLPNGNILANSPNSEKSYHLIYEGEKDADYLFFEDAYKLPYNIMRSMPYLNVINQGSVKGSICDSIITNLIITNNLPLLEVFPNPTLNYINVKINSQYDALGLTITDTKNQIVYSIKDPIQITNLNIGEFLPGTYFLNLITSKSQVHEKFIKL